MEYILAIDQGTTTSKATLFNNQGEMVDMLQKEFPQVYPRPGWVEHKPEDLWESQHEVLSGIILNNGLKPSDVAAIGIANQRETTLVWDRKTGKPVCNAIVWQDNRTADTCTEMKGDGLSADVIARTGLVIDSYFSATKLGWILDHVDGARKRAESGDLLFGTVDTWLLWKMTGGRVHATDYSNASRTMLFDIHKLEWDDFMLEYFRIPRDMLPAVHPSSYEFGTFLSPEGPIPIRSILGDQQAALFGQACFEPGMAKNTYGTGSFILMNTGEQLNRSENGLITTIGWGMEKQVRYALEGSIFSAGSVLQWLKDGLQLITDPAESEEIAHSTRGDEIYFVPAFSGLGAPHWDMNARGTILGITRDTTGNHLVKAALQSIAYQTRDVINAMEKDASLRLKKLKVDGGAAVNNYLMQFQSDILDTPVERPVITESTAWGAASLAGVGAGLWDVQELQKIHRIDREFMPVMSGDLRDRLYAGWEKALERSRSWL